jgi:quinol monooxygenase YgiN
MRCGARQLFIYYRVNAAQANEAVAAASSMQRVLREHHAGLQTALLRRPDNDQSDITLMETYALDAAVAPHGITAELQAAIDAQAAVSLGALVAGARHVEVFDLCA